MTIWDYINQGGAIMYVLLLANIVGFALMIWKGLIIYGASKDQVKTQGELSSKVKEVIGDKADHAQSLVKDEVQLYVHGLEKGLNTVKIIASISPLLGLLGTVIGILKTFQVVSEQGLSNPSLFAGGISMALITTVGGLIVAIPHLVGYNYLVGLLDDLELGLEKSTTESLIKG